MKKFTRKINLRQAFNFAKKKKVQESVFDRGYAFTKNGTVRDRNLMYSQARRKCNCLKSCRTITIPCRTAMLTVISFFWCFCWFFFGVAAFLLGFWYIWWFVFVFILDSVWVLEFDIGFKLLKGCFSLFGWFVVCCWRFVGLGFDGKWWGELGLLHEVKLLAWMFLSFVFAILKITTNKQIKSKKGFFFMAEVINN